ncbi:MAG: TetR/AcrR family transcriptional regulator [Nostoc sp.]|uniref:TetR/AcrR family transcriptional regulator n=1 Tax=Nostoc sp. TaxID=1180 RepID=UPI002FFD2121
MLKETYIPYLIRLFRQYGYDGATLSKISEATGLGKASLYHHFPGGKDEMVETVLDFLQQWLDQNILVVLASQGDALTRLRRMCDRLSELYEQGNQPCLSAILLMGSARGIFHNRVNALFRVWIDAIANVLIEDGIDEELAKYRGEDAVIAIQGSLILSQGLNDPSPFMRIIQQLPIQLCREKSNSSS